MDAQTPLLPLPLPLPPQLPVSAGSAGIGSGTEPTRAARSPLPSPHTGTRWTPADPVEPADATPADQPTLRWRSVFISDLHLGTPGCQAAALLEFLRTVHCEQLYLVGDIIDGWQLKRRWFWPQVHNDVVQKLLRKARKGTRVVFVPGNHDEFARRYDGHSFGGVEVQREALHHSADGRRIWVMHGDHFDAVVQCAPWLAHLGDHLYEWALEANRHFNSLRARLGLPYWSLSRYLKLKVKRAVSFIGDYEAAVIREARRRGVDGVVCGHIHHAELRQDGDVSYANCGDWVESLTALVEHHDGRFEVFDWASHCAHRATEAQACPAAPTQALPG